MKKPHLNIFDLSPALVWKTDSAGTFDYFNRNWLDFTGRSTERECGEGWTEGIHPEDREVFSREFRGAFGVNIPFETEYRLRRSDGEYRWIQNIGKPFWDEAGNFAGYVGYCFDRTERHETEEILRKLSRAVEQGTNAIIITDTEGCIEYVNESYTKMTGYGLEELIGSNPRTAGPGAALPDIFGDSWETLKKGEEWRGELHARKKGGEHYWEFATFSPITNAEDAVTHYLAVKEDVTVRKNTEEKLEKAYSELKATQAKVIHQEKMASIGQLAAGVAHEINNPMGFILSNIGTLRKYLDRLTEFVQAQAEVIETMNNGIGVEALKEKRRALKIDYLIQDGRELIGESLEGAERVRAIVQNLKGFARVDEAEHKLADINECIESTINIVWNELKYKVKLIRELGEIPPVQCYPQQLNQVFMNLLVNAGQAIATEGEITVRTWDDAGSIHVSVSDSGSGIPEEVQKHIFEPFFTTKEVGKGTGLGLSISYDIIKNHNGEILVDSEVGKGTTFTVRLPIV